MEHQVTISLIDLAPALRLAVVLIEGLGAVNFINWLKGALYRFFGIDVSGHKALLLTLVVSIVLAIGTLVMEGKITGESFQWQNIDQVVAVILIASKARYDMIKKQQEGAILPYHPPEIPTGQCEPKDGDQAWG